MNDVELQRIIDKASRLRALHRARARVRQLERELSGAPLRSEEPLYLPEFLRRRSPFGVTRLPSPAPQLPVAARSAQGSPGTLSGAEPPLNSTAKAS